MARHFLILLALVPMASQAASFSLDATLRAGSVGDTELALGSTSAVPAVTGDFFPFWVEGVDHAFQLAYNAATNTATLTSDWFGIFTSSINWNPTGGNASTVPRNWSVAAGGIRVTAENIPFATSIRVQGLQLTVPGLGVLSSPSLLASQNGTGPVTASNAAGISFTTPNGNGSWVLDGQIRFTGLAAFLPGATGNQLRLAFDISASDVPEPATMLISALGFAALGVLHHFRVRRRRRRARLAANPPHCKN